MTAAAVTRFLDLNRSTAASRSLVAFLVANAIPLIGVLFLGWSLWTILVLYWVENGIIGFWNVPKILLAQGAVVGYFGRLPGADRAATAGFFVLRYGLFWLIHGVFVFALPGFVGGSEACNPLPGAIDCLDQASVGSFGTIVWSSVAVGALALFLSHGASFVLNYLGRGEYLRTSPAGLMVTPYARVFILQVTIIFGAFAIAFIGAPIGALVVLVVAKTLFDLRLHVAERNRASG